MIASALAGDDILTAAQVSRKLKQLGLHVPRRKRAEGNMHLRDEDLNDFDTAKAQDSDDETLLSLRKRLLYIYVFYVILQMKFVYMQFLSHTCISMVVHL